jgi:hypothetical protein
MAAVRPGKCGQRELIGAYAKMHGAAGDKRQSLHKAYQPILPNTVAEIHWQDPFVSPDDGLGSRSWILVGSRRVRLRALSRSAPSAAPVNFSAGAVVAHSFNWNSFLTKTLFGPRAGFLCPAGGGLQLIDAIDRRVKGQQSRRMPGLKFAHRL